MLVEKRKEGIDLIPLGIGDPDLSTPDLIISELIKQVKIPENHNYPASMGEEDFGKRWQGGIRLDLMLIWIPEMRFLM